MENEPSMHLVVKPFTTNTTAMKHIGIYEPCSEDRSNMTPNERGAFCQKCTRQVYDFTNKSGEEIKSTLRELIGQPVCGRITRAQEDALNSEFEAWLFQSERAFHPTFVLSLIIVFGLTLFSCSHEPDKEIIKAVQVSAQKALINPTPQNPETLFIAPLAPTITPVISEEPLSNKDTTWNSKMIEPEEIELTGSSTEHYEVEGGMMFTPRYEEYIVQTVPSEEERDEYGNPYPADFESKVFPNPVVTQTTFELKLPFKSNFEINVFDMNGQLLQAVYSGEIDRGTFRRELIMTHLPAGMYIITIFSADYKASVKVSKI